MSLICKFYGVIDLTAAVLVWWFVPIPDIIKLLIVLVLVIKGIPSLFA